MELEALTTISPIEECLWAIFDENGKFAGGIITAGIQLGQEEMVAEGQAVIRVTRFPQAHEYWDPNAQDWAEDLETKKVQEKEAELRSADPCKLRVIIMKEVQELTYKTITSLFPDLELTAEQRAELFPMLGDET